MELYERIKQRREQLDISQDELASRLGYKSRSTIAKIESGINDIPSDKIEKFAEALNTTPSYLMGWDDKYPNINEEVEIYEVINNDLSNIINIPIVGSVRAGQPILAQQNIEGYLPTLKDFLNPSVDYFYLRIKGDSMNLEFKDGSLILVEKTTCIENGEIGVVLIDGMEATVKKVIQNANMITLIPMSSNSEHIPRMYDMEKDEIQIIGKVRQAIKQY